MRDCLSPSQGAKTGELEAKARAVLGPSAAADFEAAARSGLDGLCGRASAAGAGLVVLPAGCVCVVGQDDLDLLVQRMPCPMLLVH